MKYIKIYEKVIAAKSEEAKINPLYDFSGKLLQIVRVVTKDLIDPKLLIANRYIEDDGYITIRCQERGSSPFLKITLDYDERLDGGKVTMVVRANRNNTTLIDHFFNFINEQLNLYINDSRLNDRYLRFNFSLNNTDDIIKRLEKEEYYIYLNSKKYNI